jgi:hypothetical protein
MAEAWLNIISFLMVLYKNNFKNTQLGIDGENLIVVQVAGHSCQPNLWG